MPIEIHATLGPASFEDAVIRSLLLAGASVIRLNLSHGTRDSLPGLVDRIRRHSLDSEPGGADRAGHTRPQAAHRPTGRWAGYSGRRS